MTVPATLGYRLTLKKWQAGLMTIKQVELLVKTAWLTREQADAIYEIERADTNLTRSDPFSAEILAQVQSEIYGSMA